MNDLPLAGCRVLVTRPEEQAEALANAIEAAGGEAVRFPVIRISRHAPEKVASEFAGLPTPDIAIFVSRNAVVHGLAAVRDSAAKIAAVGPATTAELEAAGIQVDIRQDQGFTSEHLLAHPALQDVAGRSIVIARGDDGRELLASGLSERGASVSYLSAYRREINPVPAEIVAALDSDWCGGRIDCVTIMSVESLRNLLRLLPATSIEQLGKTPLVAPGDRVIQTACELVPGIPAIRASGPGTADMLNALIEWRHSGKNS